ncbi:altronate dehydratase family protein [Pedobacter aquatilis]|uniref:UxaA family hydrolase n=1 Tax=Pedobacter aquatilis TaxID=351343 RepID=UPI00292D11F1|nr:altronate dehydratase family protein [Pedobacter aquatilis]
MKTQTLKINENDNVIVALEDLNAGQMVIHQGVPYQILENIPAKHKFFSKDMEAGHEIIMYGMLVGKLQCPVQKGRRMSVENTKHAAGAYSFRGVKPFWKAPDVSKFKDTKFYGYHRSNGEVGTANHWLFIPTVFCENRNLDIIKETLHNELGYAVGDKYKDYTQQLIQAIDLGTDLNDVDFHSDRSSKKSRFFKNIDGIKFLNHSGGCGGSRADAASLSKLLAAYANHPNVAGVTLLSLGCQHLQVKDFLHDLKLANPVFDKPLVIHEQQQSHSEAELIRLAIRDTLRGLIAVNKTGRSAAGLDKLCIGVKCGGSDGFSGISANPVVGHCADLVVALGGKVLAAEFPEFCGVEQHLIDRAVDKATADKFIKLMSEYDALAHKLGSGFYMNPSPGNINDGLITDAIKSAGAAKKAGSSPIVDVLDYTEPATKSGLSLVCTPGNDVEATTGKTAAGATIILFTTGLGTPTGNPICPVVKIATNSALALRMNDIIDIDTGGVISGTQSIESLGEALLEYCIKIASGTEIPKAVALNQDDFIPWKRGVSL